jgi:amino acid transporter
MERGERMTMERAERFDHLREHSIRLPQVLFQSITHMGPGLAVAFSLLVGFAFAGAAMPLSVLLAILVCLMIANSVGQLAKQMSSAGGLYTYASQALGPKVGFLVGWSVGFVELIIAPSVFLVTGNLLATSVGLPWWFWTIVATGIVFLLNYWGVRLSTNTGIVLGTIEIAAFLALGIYMIVRAGDANTLQVFNPANSLEGTWSGVFKGMIFSILAFQGFEAAAPLGEEANHPRRTIPQAVFFSALIIGLFYLICAYGGVMGWGFGDMEAYANNPDPWHKLATTFWGVGWVIIFFALINSALGNANGGVVAATRIVYSLGRIELLPLIFGRTHPTHRTPDVAIIAQSVFALLLALGLCFVFGPIGGFSINATALTILAILVYIVICVSSMVFYLQEHRDQFNVFLHAVFPIVAILVLFVALYYQFSPLPEYPIRLGNWLALAWLLAGFLALALAAARRPRAIEATRDIFVEDEP